MHCNPIPKAIAIYTDGSSSGMATVHTPDGTHSHCTHHCSAQRVKLEVVLWALELYPEQPLNIYTDSKYVFTVFRTVETATFCQTTAEEIFHVFHKAPVTLR